MPFLKLNFRPGVNRDQTSYSGEGGWYECDKIRFFSGYPQKIGGWYKYSTRFFFGTCRQLFNWITTYADNFLALGTNNHVYIEAGGSYYNITPLSATTTGTATFTCVSGSSIITVTDASYPADLAVGDFVTFSSAATLGASNITATVLNQDYEVLSVTAGPPKTFTIRARSDDLAQIVTVTANASVSGGGGGATVAKYAISSGYVSTTYGYGWGTGGYGSTAWGYGSTAPISLQQRDWWFDNFDNDLVMNIRNGKIYYWERGSLTSPSTALNTRAVLLSSLTGAQSVPEAAMQVLVSQNDKHLLAFGCQPYAGAATDFDPLLIRWANQDEPQNWAPTTSNSAGFIRVSRGSKIIRAFATRQEILVFTNSSLYSLQFVGTTDVFALQELADNITIISPRAVATANNVTYWMGQDKFYVYSGQVQTLPCTLRQFVFQDLNYNQVDQIVCGTNEGFTEIWWFYPSQNSNWNDRYVIFNHLENAWYYGELVRTAWLDTALRSYPTASVTEENASVGYQYVHEYGINDGDAAMTSYIASSDFDLADGEQFMLTRRIIPDLNFTESTAASPTVTLTVEPKRFSGSATNTMASNTQSVASSSATLDQYTEQVFIRARGRQMSLKVESTDLGVQWQLGSLRLDVRPDGKR
jgi:hypothetical protein